jgi:hypothetical protein
LGKGVRPSVAVQRPDGAGAKALLSNYRASLMALV